MVSPIGKTHSMGTGTGVPPAGRTRVLIADDDRFFAEMLRAALAAHDEFDVVGIFENGAEAVEGAQSLKPALVLMDVAMPMLDGIEATRLLRELDDPPLVVLITGEASEADDRRAYAAGASAYLRKSEELPSVIDVVVAVSRVTSATAVHH
jgi:DNA-binding NarL/FixJ family response regulator